MSVALVKTELTDLAERINAAHEACVAGATISLQRAIELGELLSKVARRVGPGKLESWVECNCSFSFRTARRYVLISQSAARLGGWPQLTSGSARELLATAASERAVKQARRVLAADKPAVASVPAGKFAVICADPPWQYSNSGFNGNPSDHYPTMTTPEICAHPVASCIHERAALFLWAVNPMLKDALSVMNAWGFAYKTNFVWIKDRATYGKLGFYNYGRHELLLLGTRGSFLPDAKSLPQSVIEAPKSKHSRKPERVYRLIEKLYPDVPRLEVFGRKKRPSWTVWGNEVAE